MISSVSAGFGVKKAFFARSRTHPSGEKTNAMIGLFQIFIALLMASLDKTSVRNEISRLKADFEQLCSTSKISAESMALMTSRFMIVALMLAIFLEKSTQKDSKNSSKPSSQTEKDESALGHPGSHGKGKNANRGLADNTRSIETVTLSTVDTCEVCGEDLTHTPCIHLERRTRIDIVFEKVIEHVDAAVKQCPACASTVKGRFPADRHGPLQDGGGLKAFVVNLLVCQMAALNRVQKLLKAMTGVVIAEASLLKFVLRLHLAWAAWEQQATEAILKAPVIHVDETSFRVDKLNHWIHVYSSGDITLKFLHRRRGKAAVESINIIPRYGGAIVHDCWASYFSYRHCGHGRCGSHLLRELTFMVDSNGYQWAGDMKRLLQETCAKVSKSADKQLTETDWADLQQRYRAIVAQGEKELPPIRQSPAASAANSPNRMRTTSGSV